MKKNIIVLAMMFVALLSGLVGCVSLHSSSDYVPPGEEGISSSGVDSHDYQLVVEKMVMSMLRKNLNTEGGGRPVIALGKIDNHTPYNVEARMLGELIRVEILKSGKARFSISTDVKHKGGESGDLYKQLKFQNESGLVEPATVKSYGHLTGADYVLFGNVYNIERKEHGVREANYTFNLTMYECKSGEVVWADTKPIRKNIQ